MGGKGVAPKILEKRVFVLKQWENVMSPYQNRLAPPYLTKCPGLLKVV